MKAQQCSAVRTFYNLSVKSCILAARTQSAAFIFIRRKPFLVIVTRNLTRFTSHFWTWNIVPTLLLLLSLFLSVELLLHCSNVSNSAIVVLGAVLFRLFHCVAPTVMGLYRLESLGWCSDPFWSRTQFAGWYRTPRVCATGVGRQAGGSSSTPQHRILRRSV